MAFNSLVALSQEDTTEIAYGEDKALRAYLDFLLKSKLWLDVCGDSNAPSVDIGVKEYKEALLDCKRRGFRLRYVTEISNANVHYCKELAEIVELRHLDNVRANFAVTENQYLTVGSIQQSKPIPMSIFSNVKVLVEQQQFLYEALWNKAIPAEQRIEEIEGIRSVERTEVIYDQDSIMTKLGQFLDDIDSEVRIMAPRPEMVVHLDRLEVFKRLLFQKSRKGFLVKLLASFEETTRYVINRISPFVQHKSLGPLTISSIILVRDKKEALLITMPSSEQVPSMLLASSDKLFVETMVSTFEAWWNQVKNHDELLEEKTHAELLLDLITHDLGNHHQIIAPNLELAQIILEKYSREGRKSLSDHELDDLLKCNTSASKAFERSISLVENIRRLEKMYRDKQASLTAHDLVSAIDSAISTVRSSTVVHKDILFSLNYREAEKPRVFADNLLEEIFVNLFLNATKATEERQVKIIVDIQESVIADARYWMVNVSDYGHGIPDEKKPEMFTRFYSKAKGTGLGLAIARSLIERYGGKVWAGDRVFKNPAMGAKFGLILLDAPGRTERQ